MPSASSSGLSRVLRFRATCLVSRKISELSTICRERHPSLPRTPFSSNFQIAAIRDQVISRAFAGSNLASVASETKLKSVLTMPLVVAAHARPRDKHPRWNVARLDCSR
jgi:hypothetical protein